MPRARGAAGQRGEGVAQDPGLGRDSLGAKNEGEIGLCRGEPVAIGFRAGCTGPLCRQPVLHPPFGGDLECADAPAQRREIWVERALESAAQLAQWSDRRAGDWRDHGPCSFELAGRENATLTRPEPEAEEDEVDVMPGAVLDRDQRLGHAGSGIEGEGEPPEGLASRVVTARMPHCRPPDENSRDSCYMEMT